MTTPAKTREKALDLLARGFTREEVARKVKVSERTVYRWQRAEEADADADVEPSRVEDTGEAAQPAAFLLDPRAAPTELTRTILHESLQGAVEAKRDGNLTAASRLLKNAHGAAHDLARAERELRQNDDVVTIPRAELERARQAMRERVAALASDLQRTGGLVCNHCGRELRVAFARGEKE